MKNTMILAAVCWLTAHAGFAQSNALPGTWQISAEKTCFQEQVSGADSDTEKELLPHFGASREGVARIIRFHENGTGEEVIFTVGKRRSDKMHAFRYRVNGNELLLLDKKSGLMTQKLIIEELSAGVLRFHLGGKDCEVKELTRIK
ncbi:MAG: hypothetical protein MUC38_00995 [Cyclobacteriaceae bacterium]|jgi:hypothetical protein|nr:hypothetical protein [Cyclobacteriaceae bacterium]